MQGFWSLFLRPVFLRSALRANPAGGYSAGTDGAREVQEYVIPQMASLEQPGIVRSEVSDGISVGMDAGKASLSDGRSLINFFVIRLQGPVQKGADRRYFLRRKGPSGHRRKYGGQYLGSEYFRTRAGEKGGTGRVLSLRNARRKYVWVYFVRLSSGLTLSSTRITRASPQEGALPAKDARYQALFDAMIQEVDQVGQHACFFLFRSKRQTGWKTPFFMTISSFSFSWQGFCRNEVCEIFKRKSHETPQ